MCQKVVQWSIRSSFWGEGPNKAVWQIRFLNHDKDLTTIDDDPPFWQILFREN